MKHVLVVVGVGLVGLAFTAPCFAMCHKAQVCDDHGMNCHVRDVCDSTMDLPSTELPPLTPLPSTQLKPLPSMSLPPLGTTRCRYMQVNGAWQNVCQ